MTRVKYVCVYRTGPKFNPEYVYRLKRMVERHGEGQFDFVCLTNHPGLLKNEEWAVALLKPEHKGWWCLPEKFRITGPVVFSGLDTIFLKSITPFIDVALNCPKNDVYMIHPFRIPNKYNRLFANGMMVWNGDLTYMYEDYDYVMADKDFPLEQDYTSAMLIKSGKNIRVVQHAVSGIHSFKVDLKQGGPRKNTRIVIFHGEPGVHKLKDRTWVKENWK